MDTIEVTFRVMKGYIQRPHGANLATILQILSGNNSEVRDG